MLRGAAEFYDVLSECQETQDSLYISEMATSDIKWQEGHRSLGLIVPDGWHPGQNWDCFTWLGQYVLMVCVCVCLSHCVCLCVKERQ